MKITQKRRVIAQIEHQETDYIPYYLSFETGFNIENQLDQHYGSDLWRNLLDNAIVWLPLPDAIWSWAKDPKEGRYSTDIYGVKWQIEPHTRQVIDPVLKMPNLEGYEFPNVDQCLDLEWIAQARETIDTYPDHFVIVGVGSGLFERSWMLRGFEDTLIDLTDYAGFYCELIERLAVHQTGLLDRLLELPVDGIVFMDDWGYQEGILIGADRWRRIFKPHYAQMYQRVHQAGKFVFHHSCGSIEEILDDLIEIGLDVYESVQPEAKNNDPYVLKRSYGDHLTFFGGLGSQSTIPFSTPQEIKEEVKSLCKDMGRNGGYILRPSKHIQSDTPIENVAAVVEAFLEQSGVNW